MHYPRIWVGSRIPKFRDVESTYGRWDLDVLPPITTAIDKDLSWLRAQPLPSSFGYDGPHEWRSEAEFYERSGTTMDNIPTLVEQRGLELPKTYLQFISDIELVSRFRSPTGCGFAFPYLVIPERDEVFVSLMGDYQASASWYLRLTREGHSVVTSSQLIETPNAVDHSLIVQCADSLDEFLRRLYIENELWFRLTEGFPEMTPEMMEYLDHYHSSGKS